MYSAEMRSEHVVHFLNRLLNYFTSVLNNDSGQGKVPADVREQDLWQTGMRRAKPRPRTLCNLNIQTSASNKDKQSNTTTNNSPLDFA